MLFQIISRKPTDEAKAKYEKTKTKTKQKTQEKTTACKTMYKLKTQQY